MKPITINITNLIGTMVITGDKESASTQICEDYKKEINKVIEKL